MNIQRTIASPDGEDYETDFLRWTERQADALRARDLAQIDWHNLIEEVESLGRSQRKELMSRVTVILVHLLKYEHGIDRQPSAKWRTTLLVQRQELFGLLDTNPSLVREIAEVIDRKYAFARARALSEFLEYEPGRNSYYDETFPDTCPYTAEQVRDLGFHPEGQAR